jgi:hypothetical protein
VFTIDRRLGASTGVLADHDETSSPASSITITLPMLGKQLGLNVSDLAYRAETLLRVTM